MAHTAIASRATTQGHGQPSLSNSPVDRFVSLVRPPGHPLPAEPSFQRCNNLQLTPGPTGIVASHRKLPCGSSVCRMDLSCFPRVYGWSTHRNPVGATIESEILPKYAKPVPNISPRKIPFLAQISRKFLKQICIPVREQISQQKDSWHTGGADTPDLRSLEAGRQH